MTSEAGQADGAPLGPSVPDELRAFLDLYARGEYWESHEVLEGPWREGGSDFYQGLILYASAWVHWQRGNAHGVDAQLRKTLGRLDGYPDAWLGIDVEAIRHHCGEVREIVTSQTDWVDRVRPLPLDVDRARVRGDESELHRAAGPTGSGPDGNEGG